MRIDITKVEQNKDGTYNLEFDYDDEYEELIKEKLGKDHLTEDDVTSFILAEIESAVKHHQENTQEQDK